MTAEPPRTEITENSRMQDENELTLTLLGPVQAWRAGREVDLGTAQQRALLVLLVLHEGRRVGLEEIVGALWGDDAPKGAHGTVRTYISRLRRLWSREV